jgi:processive 1,2-diacylglycerol beta-glucosyltransferase
MIIIDPIPGEESRNADMIIEQGAGWKAATLAGLAYKLRELVRHPARLVRASKKASALSRPNAAVEILHDVFRLIEQRKDSK